MARIVETGAKRRERFWRILPWALVAALVLLPLAALYVMLATAPDDNIVLGRSEVQRTAAGERHWRGTIWNHSDSLYTRLDAIVLFLDADGRPLAQAGGGAARLDPGETFDIRAALPPAAARIQIYRLRWTTGDTSAVLGPWRPWPFGYVQDKGCGEIRLTIGSCTPMRPAT